MSQSSSASVEAVLPRLDRPFIDGKYVDAAAGARVRLINPATGQLLSEVAACDATDVERAVCSARRAFEDGRWRYKPPRERKRILQRLADLVDEHAEELSLLETLNVGKPIADARRLDIPKSANMIRWYAEALDKLYGDVAPTDRHALAMVTREPLGVIGAVIPWNFPLYLASYKLGPALASGNSVVLKPADQTPLTALRLAALAQEAGVPDGVFNVIPGSGPQAGEALGAHMDVDCLAFTGSARVARQFLRYAAASNLKRVQIEAGGKCPHIVLADAPDLGRVAHDAAWGIFFNQGQVCSAGSRLIVERPVLEPLLAAVIKIAREIRIGDPLDPQTQFGALVDRRHCERVAGYVQAGIAEGAQLVLGGHRAREASGGCFFEPTIFANVQNRMKIAQEEIFGPVLTVIACDDANEAVRIANDTVFGLGAAVWSRDINRALSVARSLHAGQIWVNNYDGSDLTVPWGGFKQSGNGRDRSLEAFNEYTASKTTWIEIAR